MRGIEKHFGSVRALNGASLQVKPGEIQALLGSNGSGKSTIVKIMGGVLRANAGQMLLDGEPIQINSVFDARRFGIAVAYQELSLLPQMSVMDNILLGHELCGKAGLIDRRRQRERVCALLDRLQIKCSPEALVQNISPSEQSMVEVAKALAHAPKFLLLDEVTAALHHDEVEALFAVLREEREKGTSILIVTHRMNEIYRLCDRATIFRNGETVIQEAMDRLPLNDVVFYMTGTCVSGEGESCAAPAPVETAALLSAEELVLHPQVKGISLHVNKGEIVGIGGLEGQGQTQYIKALYGALQPEKGTLRFEGKPVKLRSTDRAVRRGICYVSGDRTREAVFSLRSIEENLTAGEMALGSAWHWVSNRSVRRAAQEAVQRYAIKIGALDDSASSLSGGNQQKLAVARSVAVQPKLLLLNDPTKGVDINSRREIHRILHDCSEQGMGIVLVSSDSEELLSVCNRIYVFYEGKAVDVLTGERRTEGNLVRAMIGMTEGDKQ